MIRLRECTLGKRALLPIRAKIERLFGSLTKVTKLDKVLWYFRHSPEFSMYKVLRIDNVRQIVMTRKD